MKKSDLKTGMKVRYRNGWIRTVLLNTPNGDVLFDTYDHCVSKTLNDYNEDLTERFGGTSLNISSVYECVYDGIFTDKLGDLIWKREEKPQIEEITAEEAMKRLEEQSGKKVKIIR